MTEDDKNLYIFGGLGAFFVLFLSGFALPRRVTRLRFAAFSPRFSPRPRRGMVRRRRYLMT